MIRERYYRCYLMRGGHVARYADVFSYDDAGAINEAERILAGGEYASIEVWRGRQRVATVNKDVAPAASSNRDQNGPSLRGQDTVMAHYVGIFLPVESGGWQAIIPDVPGCRVEGPSLDKTVFIAAAALTRIVHVDVSSSPPQPRDLTEIKADPNVEVDWDKAVVTMIPLWT